MKCEFGFCVSIERGARVDPLLPATLVGEKSPVNVLGQTFPGIITGVEIVTDDLVQKGLRFEVEFEIPDDNPLSSIISRPVRPGDFSIVESTT